LCTVIALTQKTVVKVSVTCTLAKGYFIYLLTRVIVNCL